MALNLNSAVAGLPTGENFERLEDSEKVAIVFVLYRRLLGQLAEQQRDADAYERPLLYQGIYWLGRDFIDYALQYAQLACTPDSDRAPVLDAPGGLVPSDDGRALANLLDGAERSNDGLKSVAED